MKKKLLFKLFIFAVIGAFVTVTSCKDYDDDISNLEKQIAGLSSTLNDLKSKVDAGAVITSVTSTADGLTVVTDKGTYNLTNGKDGAAGAEGKAGSVVTANEDGFWYIDGVKTEYTWKGEKGEQGDKGEQGEQGAPGEPGTPGEPGSTTTGIYYEPNVDGYFYKVEGDVKTKTDMQWKQEGGMTAVVEANGDVTFAGVKAGEDKDTITIYNNRILRSLVLIPDYYVNGVEAIGISTMAYFSPCIEDEDGEEGDWTFVKPKTLVKYHMNPSSVTEEMIDTENIAFIYQGKENRFRSAEIGPNAKFVSLDKGILTVELELDDPSMIGVPPKDSEQTPGNYDYSDFMDMLALQVPLSNKALNGVSGVEATVTSDWARVDDDWDYIGGINRKGEEKDQTAYSWIDPDYDLGYRTNYNTVEAAKDEYKPYMIDVQYDKQVNLIDYLSLFTWSGKIINPADYGFKYKFDLIDGATGKAIVWKEDNNETNQQDFINLLDANKGTIKSKVFGTDGTAAIGRTPLVRVQLIDAEGCAIGEGYIKIRFVKEVKDALELTFETTADFNCEGTAFGPKVEWMNVNIYNKFEGSTKFHNNYYLDGQLYDADGEPLEDMGYAQEFFDPYWTGQVTLPFAWVVDKDAVIKANGKPMTAYVYYRDREDGEVTVKIKVTGTVTMPTLSVYGHNATYWQSTSYNLFKVNPMVYNFAGTATASPANATANIRANLLNGFVDKDGKYTSDEALIIKSSLKDFAPNNVAFVFDEEKLKDYKYYIGTTEYSVAKNNLKLSEDKTELYFVVGGDDVLAATIQKNALEEYVIALDENGTEAEANPNSLPLAPAKALVGKNVPVKITADLCGEGEIVKSVKAFEVKFIEPINIDAKLSGTFTDAVINGSRVKTADALTFTDWNGYVVRESAFATPTEKQKYAVELYAYYEVQTAVWDTNTANVKTNLKQDSDGNLVPTAGVTNGALPVNYALSYNNGELIFENQGGANVNATDPDLILYIPVSVTHKWGVTTKTVAINVKPAAGTGN